MARNSSLEKIFRGALLILAGFLGGGVLTFGLQILLARVFQPEVYGIFSQGMSVLYALVMVSLLGLNAGISRQISFNERDREAASKAVGSSLAVVLPLSLIVFTLLFLNAELIAQQLFEDARMTQVLKIFAFAGPAMAVNSIFISGFRGHQSSRERVVFLDFVIPFLQILIVGTLVFIGYQIEGAVAGYASAFLISSLGIFYWYRRNYSLSFSRETLENLVKLSWPLMVSAVVVQVFIWSPPILVGILASSRDSGLLNTALPLASSAKMFLSSVAFLYLPVVSELFGRGDLGELKNVHSSATRWISYLAIPLLGFFMANSEAALSFFFGSAYSEAGLALSVIAAGYLFNSVTGPLGELLIAIGKTRREMLANTAKLGSFAGLSVLLVPEHGFLGAAIAYSIGMILGDSLRLVFARREAGFFYDLDFFKPVIATGAALVFTQLASTGVILSIALWGLVYGIAMAFLKPLSSADRDMISSKLEERGLDDRRLNRVLDLLSS